jgi:hypothetical protein
LEKCEWLSGSDTRTRPEAEQPMAAKGARRVIANKTIPRESCIRRIIISSENSSAADRTAFLTIGRSPATSIGILRPACLICVLAAEVMPEARPGCSPNPIRHIPYFVAGFNGAVVQLAAADEQKEERRTRKNKNNPEVRAPAEYFQCCNSG